MPFYNFPLKYRSELLNDLDTNFSLVIIKEWYDQTERKQKMPQQQVSATAWRS